MAMSRTSFQGNSRYSPEKQARQQQVLMKLREQLAARGLRALVLFQQQPIQCTLSQLENLCQKQRLQITDSDLDCLEAGFGNTFNFPLFFIRLKGVLPASRKSVITEVWRRLDPSNSRIADLNYIKSVYSARDHPDVLSGLKSESEVLMDFIETFEVHHAFSQFSVKDSRVTQEEFEDYYSTVSATIPSDSAFEKLLFSVWKLHPAPVNRKGSATSPSGVSPERVLRHGPVPYGKSPEAVDYSRPKYARETSPVVPAGAATWQLSGPKPVQVGFFDHLRSRLTPRGIRGLVFFFKKLKEATQTRLVALEDVEEVLHDMRIDPGMAQAKWTREQHLECEDFMRKLCGALSENRRRWVLRVFQEVAGGPMIQLTRLKRLYNASKHPEVVSGRKSEDQEWTDFLDSFEMFHSIKVNTKNDTRVSELHFIEYYTLLSALVSDDHTFEVLLRSCWR